MMKKLIGVSKVLRRNMTKEERHLWYDFLKGLPLTVNRQKVLGPYIVDFFIASKKLAIELDGTQHFQGVGPERDRKRDEWVKKMGSRCCATTICRSTRNLTPFAGIS